MRNIGNPKTFYQCNFWLKILDEGIIENNIYKGQTISDILISNHARGSVYVFMAFGAGVVELKRRHSHDAISLYSYKQSDLFFETFAKHLGLFLI